MESQAHLRALARAGGRIAELLGEADPATPLPTCPDWTLADLVRHLGGIHRWAAAIVSGPLLGRVGVDDVAGDPPTEAALADWFAEGHRRVLQELQQSPADLECWTFFGATSPRAFWCRRQAHETAMHGVDVELALLGSATPVDARFAADGVDELLRGFLRGAPPSAPVPPELLLRVTATDAELDWEIGLEGRRRISLEEATGRAACTVTATAPDLYLLLWNRRSLQGLQVAGDPRLLQAWQTTRRIV